MARAPVREVSAPAAIQGVAAPVNTYVRPAEAAPSSLHQLAEGLAAFDSGLGTFLAKRKIKTDEADKQRAIHDAYLANGEGQDEGVKRGLIPPQESTTYMQWYKKTQYDVKGRELEDKFQLALTQWPDRNSGDPEKFKAFVGEFLKENIGEETDPDMLAGLNPHIESIFNTGYAQFTKDRADAVYSGGLSSFGASLMDTIDQEETEGTKSGNGIDYDRLWNLVLASRDEAIKRVREADADTFVVDSVLLQAEKSGNEELLTMLDRKLPGRDYAISSDPEVAKKVEASRNRIQNAMASKATKDAAAEEKEDKQRHNALVAETLKHISDDPKYQVPEDTLKEISKRDPEFRSKLPGYREKFKDDGIPEDPDALLEAYSRIDQGSGADYVMELRKKGIVKSPETLTKMLDRVKSVEKANQEGGILKSPAYKDTVKLITNATSAGPLGALDGVRELTDDGARALFDYRSQLLQWAIENPNAGVLEKEKAAMEIGKSIRDRIVEDPTASKQGLYPEQKPLEAPAASPEATQSTVVPEATPPADASQQPPQARDKAITELAQKYKITPEAAQQFLLEEENGEEAPVAQPPEAAPMDATQSEEVIPGVDINPEDASQKSGGLWGWVKDTAEKVYQGHYLPGVGGIVRPEEAPADPVAGNDTVEALPEETRTKLTNLLQNPPMLSDGSTAIGNTPVGPILDLIGHTEGTDKGDGYNETLGYGRFTGGDVNLVGMTLDQVDKLQSQMLRNPDNNYNSSAVGRYQIIRTTLRTLRKELGLKGNELYDAKMQDRLAMSLLEGRGLSRWKAGRMSDSHFMSNLSKEWASLPKADGRGTYKGQRVGIGADGVRSTLNKVRGTQVASLDPSIGLGFEVPKAYSKIPEKDAKGEDQLSKFMAWNSDPVANNEKNLKELPTRLQAVIKRAQKISGVKFVIGSGKRTAKMQKDAVKWGWSKTEDSDHLHGNAVDLWPLDKDGAVVFDSKLQLQVVKAMKQAASEAGIKLDIGADWKKFKDLPHFALKS